MKCKQGDILTKKGSQRKSLSKEEALKKHLNKHLLEYKGQPPLNRQNI